MKRALVTLLLVSLAAPALAQSQDSGGGTQNNFTQRDYGPARRAPPPAAATSTDPSLIHRQVQHWPWLEAGTVVCNSEDDLQRYHATIAARLNGEQVSGIGADCRRLTQRTSVDIAMRRGPAATQILLNSDSRQAAWTDVWLPAQRPN